MGNEMNYDLAARYKRLITVYLRLATGIGFLSASLIDLAGGGRRGHQMFHGEISTTS